MKSSHPIHTMNGKKKIYFTTLETTEWRVFTFLGVLLLSLISCKNDKTDQHDGISGEPKKWEARPRLAKPVPVEELVSRIPELAFYQNKMNEAMASDPPVIRLPETGLDQYQIMAQQLALSSSEFTRDVRHPENGAVLRSEIMGVRKAFPSDLAGIEAQKKDLYRIEMYNYFFNSTTVAIVNTDREIIERIDRFVGGQPEINELLKKIAISIAISSDEVKQALGITPGKEEATHGQCKDSVEWKSL